MNANELADELKLVGAQAAQMKGIGKHGFEVIFDSATMLRQQQAEIEALKLSKKVILKYAEEDIAKYKVEIEALKANRKHDFGLGEASGFIKGHKENPYKAITNTKIEPTVVSYTHPVKELTDEEIDNLIMEVAEKPTNEDLHDFARAILRKASEK